MNTVNTISMADLIIILLYLIGIFYLSYSSTKKEKIENTDFATKKYLASKSLTFFESLCSIIATEISALTFIGLPALAFVENYSLMNIYIGSILSRLIIATFFIPKIYDKGLTLYTTMSFSGTKNGQMAIASFYALNKFLAVGVRLLSGAILIAQFLNFSIPMALFLVSTTTFIYTLFGGLKAVVKTDMIQMFVFLIGGLGAHFIIPVIANVSWSDLMLNAFSSDKMNFFALNDMKSLFFGLTGGLIFDLSTHGVDQDFIQRLTANKSIKEAQRAIRYSALLSCFFALLFLSIGSLLWSHYQLIPIPNIESKEIFAHYIVHYFPSGLKGLMVIGVLAATMSTLDSTINALSATFYADIFQHSNKKIKSNYYIIETSLITLLLTLIAYVASSSSELILLGLKVTSWTAGSLLAIFVGTLLMDEKRRVSLDFPNVLGGYILGVILVYVNWKYNLTPWTWNVVFGLCGTGIFLMLRRLSQDLLKLQ